MAIRKIVNRNFRISKIYYTSISIHNLLIDAAMLLYTQLLSLFLDLVDARACAADADGGWCAGMVPRCDRVVGISLGIDAFASVLQIWSFDTVPAGWVIRDLPSPLIQATRLYSVHCFTKPASAGVSPPPQVTKSKVSMPHTSSGMLDFLFGEPGADVRPSKAPSWI